MVFPISFPMFYSRLFFKVTILTSNDMTELGSVGIRSHISFDLHHTWSSTKLTRLWHMCNIMLAKSMFFFQFSYIYYNQSIVGSNPTQINTIWIKKIQKKIFFCIFRFELPEKTGSGFPPMCDRESRSLANPRFSSIRHMSGFSIRPARRARRRQGRWKSTCPEKFPSSSRSLPQYLHRSLAFWMQCCWEWLGGSGTFSAARGPVTARALSPPSCPRTGPQPVFVRCCSLKPESPPPSTTSTTGLCDFSLLVQRLPPHPQPPRPYTRTLGRFIS